MLANHAWSNVFTDKFMIQSKLRQLLELQGLTSNLRLKHQVALPTLLFLSSQTCRATMPISMLQNLN